MPCERVVIGGAVGFVCSRGRRAKQRCSVEGCREIAIALCDGPTGEGRKTCSVPLCALHRTFESGLDYCPTCLSAREEGQARWRALGESRASVAYLCSCGAVAPLPCSSEGCRGAVCGRCARSRGAWVCPAHAPKVQDKQPSLPL